MNGCNFSKGQPEKAAALWHNAWRHRTSTAPVLARIRKSDYFSAVIGFRSALRLAQLNRVEESLEAYAEAMKILGPPGSTKNPRDLGESYARWYLAEAHRREAEQALKAKGASIPAVETQSK